MTTENNYEVDTSYDRDHGEVIMIDVDEGPIFLTREDLQAMLEML